MEVEIAKFQARHPELALDGVIPCPGVCTVYVFTAPDGVKVNVSIDFEKWKHMSFSKRQPDSIGQATESEMARYLDFFGETKWHKILSPIGTGVIHFYEVGHPEFSISQGIW